MKAKRRIEEAGTGTPGENESERETLLRCDKERQRRERYISSDMQ